MGLHVIELSALMIMEQVTISPPLQWSGGSSNLVRRVCCHSWPCSHILGLDFLNTFAIVPKISQMLYNPLLFVLLCCEAACAAYASWLLLLLQCCLSKLMLLQVWCMHPRGIRTQMMTGSSCLSIYGILCAEVLRVSPQLTRTQTLIEAAYPITAYS